MTRPVSRALPLAFCLLACQPALAKDRGAAWREDIAVARSVFLEKDKSFSPAERRRAEAELDRLAAKVERLSDVEIQAGLARTAAFAHNAHTRAYLLRNRGVWRRYPIRIWRFQDGWRVVAARPELAKLVGAKVVEVAGLPADEAARRMRPLYAGNDNWARYMAAYTLTSSDALIGSGLLKGDGAGRFVFEQDGRRMRVSLEPVEARREVPEEAWWFLSPAHKASDGWVQALQGRPLPPVLAGAGRDYSFTRCDGGAAYLQYNRAENAASGEPVRDFSARVLAELESSPPSRLVIDLRFNTGGDLTKAWPFFKALAASRLGQTPGAIAVIVGPNTFSAGITPAVQMRQFSKASLVGTEPGDELEYWSEGGNVKLPNSGLNMHYGDKTHTYSLAPVRVPKELLSLDLNVKDLRPDRSADWTWAAYRAGRDPYAEAALGRPLRCPAV